VIGQHEAAINTAHAAVKQFETALGKSDAMVGLALSNLASFLVLDGKAQQAVTYAERAFRILTAVLGKHNETTRNCAVNLANIYKSLNRTSELKDLDETFSSDDVPLLDRKVGEYSQKYLSDLKNKWYSQGPRAIFDPPGLHRSANLSALSYNAFLEEWKNKLPLESTYADVVVDELSSIGYSFDKLKKYEPRLPAGPNGEVILDHPVRLKTGFEHLQLPKPVTSLAAELDKEAKHPPLSQEDITITGEEWTKVAERQAEYRALHGDPMHEAEEDEFARSEKFFAPSAPKDSKEAPRKVDFRDFTFMNEDTSEGDWDGDTYDATTAVHGTPEEQAYERSKSPAQPSGDANLIPPKNKTHQYMTVTQQAAQGSRTRRPREAAQGSEGTQANYDFSMGAGESQTETSGEAAQFGDEDSTVVPEEAGRRATVDPESNFWEGVKPKGDIGSGPSGKTPQQTPSETAEKTADPYQHNPDEDDVFPERKPAKPISPDQKTSDEDIAARQKPKYRYGRLHDDPWHDDFR
jgi:hypothetical protein